MLPHLLIWLAVLSCEGHYTQQSSSRCLVSLSTLILLPAVASGFIAPRNSNIRAFPKLPRSKESEEEDDEDDGVDKDKSRVEDSRSDRSDDVENSGRLPGKNDDSGNAGEEEDSELAFLSSLSEFGLGDVSFELSDIEEELRLDDSEEEDPKDAEDKEEAANSGTNKGDSDVDIFDWREGEQESIESDIDPDVGLKDSASKDVVVDGNDSESQEIQETGVQQDSENAGNKEDLIDTDKDESKSKASSRIDDVVYISEDDELAQQQKTKGEEDNIDSDVEENLIGDEFSGNDSKGRSKHLESDSSEDEAEQEHDTEAIETENLSDLDLDESLEDSVSSAIDSKSDVHNISRSKSSIKHYESDASEEDLVDFDIDESLENIDADIHPISKDKDRNSRSSIKHYESDASEDEEVINLDSESESEVLPVAADEDSEKEVDPMDEWLEEEIAHARDTGEPFLIHFQTPPGKNSKFYDISKTYNDYDSAEEVENADGDTHVDRERGVESDADVDENIHDIHKNEFDVNAQKWLTHADRSSQFALVKKQLLRILTLHILAALMREGSTSVYALDRKYKTCSAGFVAVCILTDVVLSWKISKAKDNGSLDMKTTSILGKFLRKKARFERVTLQAHDWSNLVTVRIWTLIYLALGVLLSMWVHDFEPLFIYAALAFFRYTTEPVFFTHILQGGKSSRRPFVVPQVLPSLLGVPHLVTPREPVLEEEDTEE